MVSVGLFVVMAAFKRWSLYQLNVKNVFLNGDLKEEIYMEKPPSFVAQEESSRLYVVSSNLYMASNSILGLGSANLALLFNNLVLLAVR